MIVWLWDTHGPDRAGRGVTDDEERARQTAEAWMRSGQGSTGSVEKAFAVLGIHTLTSG